ncbi:hypothetical protein OH77DRAFT_1579611 [Trametes cingulata]|nr:hypothetical protein OH77DRAFT_1579611 [Trametes cingulata]
MPETLKEMCSCLAKQAADQAQLTEEIWLVEEEAKQEAEEVEAQRKATEEAEQRKAAEERTSDGARKCAIEVLLNEKEKETPQKKHARKRQEVLKGKGKATDDGPTIKSQKACSCMPCHKAHMGCTFDGKLSMGPMSEAVWSADPAPAHLLTSEELLWILLVEVQRLQVQLRDDLEMVQTSLRTTVTGMWEAWDLQKQCLETIMAYMANT